MKNLEEVRNEYRMFRERQYEIHKALDENAKEYSKDYKKSIFGIFEDEWYHDFVMENLEHYSDEIDPENFDKEKLYEEYMEYLEYLTDIINRRLDLYEENKKWQEEFKQWKRESGFHNYTRREFDDCEKKYDGEWYGWDSNDLIFYGMLTTIGMTDQDEINKLIENAKKVLNNMVNFEPYDDYLFELEHVNNHVRNQQFEEGCTHVYVLDHLENDGMWQVYREPFQLFVDKVFNMIDSEYLHYITHEEWYTGESQEE